MKRSEILPAHFEGTWKLVAGVDTPAKQVTITRDDKNYSFCWRDGPSQHMSYDEATDNAYVPAEKLCISFWRHPSMDHIFARSLGNGSPLWGARRQREVPGQYRKEHDEICNDICGKWKVMDTVGHGTPCKGSMVFVARAGLQDRKEQGLEVPRLFYLFEEKPPNAECKRKTECYDILAFDGRTVTFNSIFRVRSINYWSNNGKEKMIFAMFDNRFTLPVGHFESSSGESRIGSLLSFEMDQVAEVAKKVSDSPATTTEDPNTGCWTGSGG